MDVQPCHVDTVWSLVAINGYGTIGKRVADATMHKTIWKLRVTKRPSFA